MKWKGIELKKRELGKMTRKGKENGETERYSSGYIMKREINKKERKWKQNPH